MKQSTIEELPIKKIYIHKKCPHGRQKRYCKECGGSGICEHGRQKSQCKECGGSGICEHGRQKSYCKECGGSGICEHGRQKSQCKECGGSGICEHGRQKSYCKECGGSAICEHGRQKRQCKECGGSSICEHDRRKSTCKECGGSSICEHGREKGRCKECGGSGICEHGRRKSQCKVCGGSAICEHGRQKSQCKECGGSGVCEHGKWKSTCFECGGRAVCKTTWCSTIPSRKYDGYCLQCTMHLFPEKKVARNYKTKETEVVSRVKSNFPDVTWITDKTIADGCSKRRPDMLLDMGSHVVILEIDENRHQYYTCSCESKRVMELSQDLGNRPLVVIRFNPDAYTDINGTKIPSCWRANKNGLMVLVKTRLRDWDGRIRGLFSQVDYWQTTVPAKELEVIELFY